MKRAAMLLLCAGCVAYRPQPVSVQENARTLETRTLPATPSKDDLIRAAIELHPDLAVARAELEAAKAAIRESAQRPNPSVNAGLERKSGSGSTSPWITSLNLDIPFETAGKRGVRVRQAQAMTAEAAANVDQAIWNVRANVGRAWNDAARAQALMALRKQEAAMREEVVSIYEKRVEVGESGSTDLARARAEARTARAAAVAEGARLDAARDALAAAIGIPRNALPEDVDFAAPVPLARTLDDPLREAALTSRPDVLAALARYDAADAALRMEVKKQYPDVHVSPGIGWDQGAFKWAIGAAAELPLFNHHEGSIARAEAERDRARAQLLAVQARVLTALDAARTRERAARERAEALTRVADSRAALLSTARRAFAAGEIDRLELRLAEIENAAAVADREDAQFDIAAASVELEAAVEQPLGGSQ